MSKPIIKANLKGSDKIELVYNDRAVEMTITDFFTNLPSNTLVISNTPSPATSGIYSGSGFLPGNITVNGLSGYTIYFTAIDEFKIFANKFLLENGECTFTSGDYEGTIDIDTLTDNRTYTLPDVTGEIQVGPAVKRYKALLSQNAPVSSTIAPNMVLGQIWNMDTHDVADDAKILEFISLGYLELYSGTVNTVNSKYRALIDIDFSMLVYVFTDTFSYDGSPYIVSTDANGDLNPFVNTLGGDIVWSYSTTGRYFGTLIGKFLIGKVRFSALCEDAFSNIGMYRNDDDTVGIKTTNSSFSSANNILHNTSIEIEVYP